MKNKDLIKKCELFLDTSEFVVYNQWFNNLQVFNAQDLVMYTYENEIVFGKDFNPLIFLGTL